MNEEKFYFSSFSNENSRGLRSPLTFSVTRYLTKNTNKIERYFPIISFSDRCLQDYVIQYWHCNPASFIFESMMEYRCTDGCNSIYSETVGLSAHVQQKCVKHFCMWCACHRYDLAVESAVMKIESNISTIFINLKNLSPFVRTSPIGVWIYGLNF